MVNRFETNKEFYLRNMFILLKYIEVKDYPYVLQIMISKYLSPHKRHLLKTNMTKLIMSRRRKVIINSYGNFL